MNLKIIKCCGNKFSLERYSYVCYNVKNKKGCDIMLELEENTRLLQKLQEKMKKLGESL